MCTLGDTYPLDIHVTASLAVCDVVVNANLPDGVTVVRSEPEGIRMEGRRAVWKIGSMDKCEQKCARIFLKADVEGDLCVCFCASAVPVQFCGLVCAKPLLTCEKCGPKEVCPGDPVPYVITVTNNGSCAAEDVVVTDIVPDQLEHASGLRSLVYKLGTIEACETKKINVCFTAVKRGIACNRILVTACNANQTGCEFCTCVCCCKVELTKTGPKEVGIGKTAEYLLTVVNTGDKVLTDVQLTDCPSPATSIVEAKGAQVSGNTAVWRFKELKPGEKQQFVLVLTTCTPGYYCNKAQVTNCQQCCAVAEACTRWKGRPALNLCVNAASNPICIGDVNTYTITVVNQGSDEDRNVKVTVNFPDELKPLSGSGATGATVSGQSVTFAPFAIMGPRQTVTYRVDAKAVKSGDDPRIKVEVSSDSVKTPLVEETSTIVN